MHAYEAANNNNNSIYDAETVFDLLCGPMVLLSAYTHTITALLSFRPALFWAHSISWLFHWNFRVLPSPNECVRIMPCFYNVNQRRNEEKKNKNNNAKKKMFSVVVCVCVCGVVQTSKKLRSNRTLFVRLSLHSEEYKGKTAFSWRFCPKALTM